jgi:Na+/H+-dicarboxylate symporter
MKKKVKSQNPILKLSQNTYIVIIAILFAYSVYVSTNPVVSVSSNGFDTGFSSLYNLLLITILVPIAIFLLFYKYILSNSKKSLVTSAVFYGVVYTLFAFVVQGVIGHYVFQFTTQHG